MSHIYRFFGGASDAPKTWLISPFEYVHLKKVLRLKVGDPVEVMDGKGQVAYGALSEISAQSIYVGVEEVEKTSKPSLIKIFGLGALKPGDVDEILSPMVELGADEIHIFLQDDIPRFRTNDKAIERWLRIVQSAVKQSKRSWIPPLHVHGSLKDFLDCMESIESKIVLDVSADNILTNLSIPINVHSLAAIVGGERGLNEAELRLCKEHGFMPYKMGSYVLRARTAVLAAVAIISAFSESRV